MVDLCSAASVDPYPRVSFFGFLAALLDFLAASPALMNHLIRDLAESGSISSQVCDRMTRGIRSVFSLATIVDLLSYLMLTTILKR
jgi:hypothetical protein